VDIDVSEKHSIPLSGQAENGSSIILLNAVSADTVSQPRRPQSEKHRCGNIKNLENITTFGTKVVRSV
jgi:hypothetical protein